jgi:hypothetical protein
MLGEVKKNKNKETRRQVILPVQMCAERYATSALPCGKTVGAKSSWCRRLYMDVVRGRKQRLLVVELFGSRNWLAYIGLYGKAKDRERIKE